jgi:hypothetical protein
MKNKKKIKQRNFVLKNMMVGEHGAKRTIVVHRSKKKYYRKDKHKGNWTDRSASFFYFGIGRYVTWFASLLKPPVFLLRRHHSTSLMH